MLPSGIQCMWSFTINIYGDTYIESRVPYMVTCTISKFKEGRITTFNVKKSATDQLGVSIRHSTEYGCFILSGTYRLCQSSLCSCDTDGLATHWIYSTPADLSSSVTFICSSSDNNGVLQSSVQWTPTVSCKCLVFVS